MQGTFPTESASERCVRMIRERCSVAIQQLHTTYSGDVVQITGTIGSWHGKQLASESARAMFPNARIDNRLTVVKPR